MHQAPTTFEDAQEELRRRKLAFVAAETQLRLLDACRRGEGSAPWASGHTEAQRRGDRARNKELKVDLRSERGQHDKLCRQLAEALREARDRQTTCERDGAQLAFLGEVEAPEASPRGSEGTQAMDLGPVDRETAQQARLAAASVLERSAGALRQQRRQEEEELRQVVEQRRRLQAQREEYERLEAVEASRVRRLEALAAKEVALGLPRIRQDEAAGKVSLEGAAGARPEMQTIRVQRDQDGRLVRAEPHPSLGLWDEGTLSVEQDDLARLITLVWDRLHGSGPSEKGSLVAECGGA